MKAPRVYPNEYVLNEVRSVNEQESVFFGLENRPEFSYDAFFCYIFTVEDFDKAGLARQMFSSRDVEAVARL